MKNRIIKFRVWTGKKMCDDFVLDWRQGFIKIGGVYETFAPTSINSKHKVMQFTGLTDKNGKEIYEGDIVKNGRGAIRTVFWDSEMTSWYTKSNINKFLPVSLRIAM